MRAGMIKLRTFPRNRLIEAPLCHVRTSELSLYQSLGDPTGTTDPIDADPRLYWDLAVGVRHGHEPAVPPAHRETSR